jgi:prepilin-type processing-associated H-X9-DG protein
MNLNVIQDRSYHEMRFPMNALSKRGSTVSNHFGSKRAAFTLIELLVVMATIAVMAVMLLSALAGTQAQSKTAACTARFRQWAVSADLYANDNRGWLPTANPAEGGAYAWDVGTAFPGMLDPYGMDVPVWFCPMRSEALDIANRWAQFNFGHPIQSVNELKLFWSGSYPKECSMQGCCNYWVPRYNISGTPPPGATPFPPDYSNFPLPPHWITAGNPTCLTYGWPQRLHDIAAPYVPFVSDPAGSGYTAGLVRPISGIVGPNVTNISPNTAHFVNNTLLGVNCAYADGHVAAHNPNQMRAVYLSGSYFWFY